MTDDKALQKTQGSGPRRGLSRGLPRKLVAKVFWALTAEWLVDHKNSGTAIALRTVFISGLVLAAVWATSLLPVLGGFLKALPWIGAVAAGVYTALYTRFASQWSYLAGLYNQIMQTASSTSAEPGSAQHKALLTWKVGFIVDAWFLHLTLKDPFLGTIRDWLRDDEVRTRYVELNGKNDLKDLLALIGEEEATS